MIKPIKIKSKEKLKKVPNFVLIDEFLSGIVNGMPDMVLQHIVWKCVLHV